MNRIILYCFMLFFYCCKSKDISPATPTPEINTIPGVLTTPSIINSGTLTGSITLIYGDCMPGPEAKENCQSKRYETYIYFTERSSTYSKSKLIDSVKTDSKGEFTRIIPRGQYSVFIDYEGVKDCAYWISSNDDSDGCSPFSIGKDSLTSINVTLNRATQ